jgi:ABC-type enterochelin transport system substrate-binding protein
MACPKCGCKVHYQYNEADFGQDDERMERCAACGEIFDIEDSADECAECAEHSIASAETGGENHG